MKLIENWRAATRLWSVRVNALGAAVMAFALAAPGAVAQAWAVLPAEMRALVPHPEWIAMFLFAAGIIARVIHQEHKDG